MDIADKEALRLRLWQIIQEFNEGGTPETNPEYVRGQVELFLDAVGREDESEYKEELMRAVFDGNIEDPDAVMWPPKDVDVQDWQYEVANGDTVLGLAEWRAHRAEAR